VSERAQRFARLVQRELSELLQRGVKDPRVSEAGLVTVTHVRVADDLGVARVLVTLHGGDAIKEKALLAGLSRASAYLRAELMRRLKAKKVPELRFELDRTDERADRVTALLREIAEEGRPEAGGAGEGDDEGGGR
jgi:ribosome-binding factor A